MLRHITVLASLQPQLPLDLFYHVVDTGWPVRRASALLHAPSQAQPESSSALA